MPEITDEMAKAGAAILDPMLSSDCPYRVARDVYAAMAAVGYAEVDRALDDLNESPAKPDPEAFAQLGKIMAGKSGVDWGRFEELVKSRLVEVKTVQRPDFGDGGGSSGFYKMSPEQLAKYRAACWHLTPPARKWFRFGDGLSTPEATGGDKSAVTSDGRW